MFEYNLGVFTNKFEKDTLLVKFKLYFTNNKNYITI